ncbi:Uncharacterised protein [Mycobacteroides abscessus subsp. abscessus]|nr:Uncharacterised protein [Mycobacteroides abscessus subsp. abscessus]
MLVEDSFTHRFEFRQRVAAQVSGGTHHQTFEFHAAQLVPESGLQYAEYLAHAGLAPTHPVTSMCGGCEAGHERAVQVEERSNLWAHGAQCYVGHRIRRRVGRHVRQSTVARHTHRPQATR